MSGREPARRTQETGHDNVRDRLSDYLDGQLLGKERQAVEEHLAACSSCRWELQTLRQTVLWTRDLPTMPVPRSFALPVPAAAPARAARPRWRLVPAFQLATAMVALLLFFVVAGDLTLTSMRPAAPARDLVQSEAAQPVAESVVVEVTKLVEVVEAVVTEEAALLLQAVPAEPAPETAVAKAAEPSVARVLPTEAPLAEEAALAGAAAPEATATPDLAATMTAAPPGMGGGVPDSEAAPAPVSEGDHPASTESAIPAVASDTVPATAEAVVGVPVTLEAAAPAVEAEATPAMEATALAEPGAAPAPQATAAPAAPELSAPSVPPLVPGEETLADATAQFQAEEAVEALAAAEPSAAGVEEWAAERADDGTALQARAGNWLRPVEYGLATLLVLLVGTTAALMVWRRRAG